MLYGDRDGGDLDALRRARMGRRHRHVRLPTRASSSTSVSLLRDTVPFYAFISSVSAYGDLSEPPTPRTPAGRRVAPRPRRPPSRSSSTAR